MKVFFLNNSMTHYYNLVLNRISTLENVDLTLIVPSSTSVHVGEGVYQTRTGIRFRVIELREVTLPGGYASFRGLAGLLFRERPDIIVTADIYLLPFLFNLPILIARKLLGIKVIMKSIPFRVPLYENAMSQANSHADIPGRLPQPLFRALSRLGVMRLIRMAQLRAKKAGFNVPDAHVNYIDDAYRVYGSYGVPRERIFITGNSPDTDALADVRRRILAAVPILPPCDHRLIYVGRLVAWKRVDLLIRSFARVKQRYEDAELLVIGGGPEEQALRALGDSLGLAGSIRFLGGIYDSELLGRYLMASSLYVLSGMGGLSINEAMCFGLPVLCSVGDGTEKKLVRDGYNGRYFRDNDEDDLTEKIVEIIADPAERAVMGERSLQIIRDEVNIHTVIKGYQDAFRYVRGWPDERTTP